MSSTITNKEWQISALSGAIAAGSALLLFNRYTFELVNRLVDSLLGTVNAIALLGCPTTTGLIVHSLVLFVVVTLISYAIMKYQQKKLEQ